MAFEWHFSVPSAEPFVGVCRTTAFNTTKWTTCEKKLLRIFLLCLFVFTLGGQNLDHLGQNRSRLSNRVPKTSPIKKFLWIAKQVEEIGNWANFSRTVGQKFRRGYQKCNLNDHRSIDRYYLFLSVFSVFQMLLNLERKSCQTWLFFSAVSSKLFAKSEDHFEVKCFFQKGFVFLLKVYEKVTKKLFFFVEKSMQVVQTAIYFSRGAFRGFFWQKNLKVSCAKQVRTFGRNYRWGLSKSKIAILMSKVAYLGFTFFARIFCF